MDKPRYTVTIRDNELELEMHADVGKLEYLTNKRYLNPEFKTLSVHTPFDKFVQDFNFKVRDYTADES